MAYIDKMLDYGIRKESIILLILKFGGKKHFARQENQKLEGLLNESFSCLNISNHSAFQLLLKIFNFLQIY